MATINHLKYNNNHNPLKFNLYIALHFKKEHYLHAINFELQCVHIKQMSNLIKIGLFT
jgi:hypothetical protein